MLNSISDLCLFVLLSFCLFVFLSFCLFVFSFFFSLCADITLCVKIPKRHSLELAGQLKTKYFTFKSRSPAHEEAEYVARTLWFEHEFESHSSIETTTAPWGGRKIYYNIHFALILTVNMIHLINRKFIKSSKFLPAVRIPWMKFLLLVGSLVHRSGSLLDLGGVHCIMKFNSSNLFDLYQMKEWRRGAHFKTLENHDIAKLNPPPPV